ncbi:MAG: Uma2 family endonuclease [Chloroflexaceae bacterium]|nr:Uma2 family endonuclease [Chloroflexaceae bacterium]
MGHDLNIVYPESDGQPMADNTVQFQWIVTIKTNLDALFRDQPEVFVAGDLLWYPVKGRPDLRRAPDVLVVFGRPKGHRGSYRQWEEDGVGPQVVFEILSPGNDAPEMEAKWNFYDRYGVEEYYLYDPEDHELRGWWRMDDRLHEILPMQGWQSPRLGIWFVQTAEELHLYRPNGQRFLTFDEVEQRAEQAEWRARKAEWQARVAEQQARLAEQRAEKLAARLRALGIDPDAMNNQ